MKLVGQWLSGYTRYCGVTLGLLGIPFVHINPSGGVSEPEARLQGAMKEAPMLILEDGEVLFNHVSIIDHLNSLVEIDSALLPPHGRYRRRTLNLVGVGLSIYGKLSELFEENLRPENLQSSKVIARLKKDAFDSLEMLENRVTDGWLVADRLSQADIISVICYQCASLLVMPDAVNERTFPQLASLAQRSMEYSAFSSTAPMMQPKTMVSTNK